MSDRCPRWVRDESDDWRTGTHTVTVSPCVLPAEHGGRCVA